MLYLPPPYSYTMAMLVIKTLLCFLLLVPLSKAHRTGALAESCYGHEIDHSNPENPPAFKQDCISNCRYDLILTGRVDEESLQLLEQNVTVFECGLVYSCKFITADRYYLQRDSVNTHSLFTHLGVLTPSTNIGYFIQARSSSEFDENSSIWGEWLDDSNFLYQVVECQRNKSSGGAEYQVCMNGHWSETLFT